jgi:hypothetical protein
MMLFQDFSLLELLELPLLEFFGISMLPLADRADPKAHLMPSQYIYDH